MILINEEDRFPKRLAILFLLIILVFALGGWFYNFQEQKKIKSEKQKELALISQLKADQVGRWRQERLNDGLVLFKNALMSHRIKQFQKQPRSFPIKQEIFSWMISILNNQNYSNVFLLDPQGRIVLVGGNEEESLGRDLHAVISEVGRDRNVMMTTLFEDAVSHSIHMDLIVPILDPDDAQADLVGFFIIRIDPYQVLYPLLQSWPIPSQSAETILLKVQEKDFLCLNDLRHQRKTALSLRLPLKTFERPRGTSYSLSEGLFEFSDYRSKPVLGSLQKISNSHWFLLSKVDGEEIFEEKAGKARMIILLVCLAIIGAGASLAFLWRNQRAGYYRQKYEFELEREQKERALQEKELRYRTLFDIAQEGILVIRGETIIDCNPVAEHLFGIGREEMLQKNFFHFSPQYQADGTPSIEKGKEYVQKAIHQGPQRYEWVHQTPEGRHLEVEVSLCRFHEEGVSYLLGMMRDITERKLEEEARLRLEERLQRAEKMEALGTLAGGVAHDLNNVLGVLVGYSELLMFDAPDGSSLRDHASNILQAGQRATAIIQDLLTLARRGVAVSQVVNLNQIIADFLNTPEFERLKSHHPQVTFRIDLTPDLLHIKGSPVHLGKTIMNLLSNGAEALSGPGEVSIRTENCYIDQPIPGYEETREGEYVLLSVSDTGMGISPVDLQRIFEPFYTKKVMGRSGTGLGLAVVWGTVKDHQGYIDVRSTEGKGSTFVLYFPVTREAIPEDLGPLARSEYLGQGETILVVDDVPEQRSLAAAMLGNLGYRVQTVSGGEEAVEVLRAQAVDLLVLDMIMDPGIDGLETYKRILAIHPGQRAIIVSGFSETDRVRQAQALGAGAYVRKPYVLEKIGLAVRRELDRKP
jgi:PAS domain S-box-containing protein